MGGGYHCTLVSRVHGKQVSPIIPILIRGETEAQRSPPALLLAMWYGKGKVLVAQPRLTLRSCQAPVPVELP